MSHLEFKSDHCRANAIFESKKVDSSASSFTHTFGGKARFISNGGATSSLHQEVSHTRGDLSTINQGSPAKITEPVLSKIAHGGTRTIIRGLMPTSGLESGSNLATGYHKPTTFNS
jgi:hypothetical protein